MRYWLYKNNTVGGPAGYFGDWEHVFAAKDPVPWGGHYSTRSAEVHRYLDEDVQVGDVVVAYQTDRKVVVGFLRIVDMRPSPHGVEGIELVLQPIHKLDDAFKIHDHKAGTVLADSAAVKGRVMLWELERAEMEALAGLSGAPKRVLNGR